MTDRTHEKRFEALALPHLDAAYNLARWITRNDHDAQDVVQESWLRAMKYADSFRGENVRPWLLRIVRNTCFSWMKANRPAEMISLDDEDGAAPQVQAPASDEPLAAALRVADRDMLDKAIQALPITFRDVIVLREMEDLSYQQIARITDVPIGTVMSRLARGRALLRQALAPGSRPALRRVTMTQGGAK